MKARISQFLQVLVAIAGWLVFGAMWWWAFAHRGPSSDQIRDLVVVAVFSFAVVVITSLWVRYNVQIYRIKGPRTRIPEGDRDYSHDTVGRPVMADFATLAYERSIVVDIIEGPNGPVKVYSVAAIQPLGGEEAACTTSCSA